jgi:hypothetical protein
MKAYDVGDSVQIDFGQAVINCTSELCTITRNTAVQNPSDGVLKLTQMITMDSEIDGPHKRLKIRMTIKHLSPVPVQNVFLRRQVDFNIDSGGTEERANTFNNYATTGGDGAIAWNAATGAYGPPAG